MAQRAPADHWRAVPVHRRWAWFFYACFLAALLAGALAALVWIIRPRSAVHPLRLIGDDVDGLVFVELSRSSPRVAQLLQTLLRSFSYEVQSRPEDLALEASRLLDVMTYRRAVGLLRYDPATDREQWALIVALKRMGDPLKVLVRQLATREGGAKIEMEASSGTLRFWGRGDMPCFAIQQRALVAAGDRPWLDEVLSRLENPMKITPRARQLYYGLPSGGRHGIVRACVLVPAGRWQYWAAPGKAPTPAVEPIRRVRRFLAECGLEPAAIRSLAAAVAIQPRGQLQYDLRLACVDTTTTLGAGRRMRENWPRLSASLRGRDMAELAEPTTSAAAVSLGWTTPPFEELLGLGPAAAPKSPSQP